MISVVFAVFIMVFVCMIIIILAYLIYKSAKAAKKSKWGPAVSKFIQTVIFKEVDDVISIPAYVIRLLKIKYFRRYMAAEIRKTKASLSGDAATNLVQLYKRLELGKDIPGKLKSGKWHIKVQAVKEIADMELTGYLKIIFRCTNHTNEFLRIESQCALVDLYGFPALRFLNVTTHPLSDWQQILLLHKLNHTIPGNVSMISKWLQSNEVSIVIFALKLISKFKCYQLHSNVVQCLDHISPMVRIEAIKCLRDIFMEETGEDLINHQKQDNKQYELLLLGSLQGHSPRIETGFLLNQLANKDDDIKYAAAKILFEVMPGGENILYNYSSATIAPWKQIIKDLKNAKAA